MKNIKKIIPFIVLIIVFNTTFLTKAVAVSDNDGATFISKGEFDSLKSSFQSQIDQYNAGIDSKIEGAIAGYLKGIRTEKDPVNQYEKIENAQGKDLVWANTILAWGESELQMGLDLTFERRHCYKKFTNINFFPNAALAFGSATNRPSNYIHDKLYYYVDGYRDEAVHGQPIWGNYGQYNPLPGEMVNQATAGWVWTELARKTGAGAIGTSDQTTIGTKSERIDKFTSTLCYHDLGGGRRVLRYLYTKWQPTLFVDAQCYTSKTTCGADYSYVDTYWLSSGKLGDSTAFNVTIANPIGLNIKVGTGTKIAAPDFTKASDTYYTAVALLSTTADNDIDIECMTWGANTDVGFNMISDKPYPVSDTSATAYKEQTVEDTTFYDVYMSRNGFALNQNTISGATLKWNAMKFVFDSGCLHHFENTYIRAVAGEDTVHGEGAPLFSVEDDTKRDIKIEYKLKASAPDNITILISDKKFVDCSFQADAELKFSKVYSAGDTLREETLPNLKKGTYWVLICANTDGVFATLEDFDVSISTS